MDYIQAVYSGALLNSSKAFILHTTELCANVFFHMKKSRQTKPEKAIQAELPRNCCLANTGGGRKDLLIYFMILYRMCIVFLKCVRRQLLKC